jgi:hypothetical protein
MKHTRKMVLVDYEKYIRNEPKAEMNVMPKPIFNLDKEMNDILNINGLSDREKHYLYLQKLNRFLHFVNEQKKKNVRILPVIKEEKIKEEEEEEEEEAEADSSHADNTSMNSENFFDPDTTFMYGNKSPQKTSTPEKQNAEGSANKRKKEKKTIGSLLARSPFNLRSKSNKSKNKSQIGGWIGFNKINLLCRSSIMCKK